MSQPITTLTRALNLFSQFDNKMQLSTALTLLYVARFQNRPEGVTTQDLVKFVGMTPAAASRNSYYWAEGTPDMPNAGYGLISVHIDPKDRRRRLLKLSPRGETYISQLSELFDAAEFPHLLEPTQ